jgi:hypothetical protein
MNAIFFATLLVIFVLAWIPTVLILKFVSRDRTIFRLPNLLTLALVLNFTDWLTTVVSINYFGGVEGSPVLRLLMTEGAGSSFAIIKLVGGSLLLTYAMTRNWSELRLAPFSKRIITTDPRGFPLALIITLALCTLNNAAGIALSYTASRS